MRGTPPAARGTAISLIYSAAALLRVLLAVLNLNPHSARTRRHRMPSARGWGVLAARVWKSNVSGGHPKMDLALDE